jgi:hypothetical protein
MLRALRIASLSLLFSATLAMTAQTIPASEAPKHVGEQATVCGIVANKHVASQSRGKPTFLDIDKSYPNQSLTVVVWESDIGSVGSLPKSGQICAIGRIDQYRGGAQIVLHTAASWYVPKPQSAPAQAPLSSNRTYINSDGQQVHSPAYSPAGVPAGATALCGDGTYSFSQHRSGTCSHHGGVAKWL